MVTTTHMIRWIPPKENWVKFNTNGACEANNIVVCGCIVKNLGTYSVLTKQNCGERVGRLKTFQLFRLEKYRD